MMSEECEVLVVILDALERAIFPSEIEPLATSDTESLNHDEDRVEDEILEDDETPDSPRRHKGRKRENTNFRKSPQAPKRFKSSYICFFMAKQNEIKEELGDKATVTDVSKRSAQLWKLLSSEEREHWDDVAEQDKQRYISEKASYTGPWQVPWKRAKKDPSAPKRPMSAFLYFSQGRRQEIKDQNPTMKNTEVSRLLGELWRNASEEERQPHIDREKQEREKYKVAIAQWRKECDEKKEEQRKQTALQATQNTHWTMPPNVQPYPVQEHPDQTQGYPQASYPPAPYGMPPSVPPYGNYPPPPPGYYGTTHSQSMPPPPYQYPINGKQPIILGPNGMPHYPPIAPPPPPPPPNYEPRTPSHSGMPTYNYSPEQGTEPQTAE
eukprot:Nitzschia sp. Nitz4//scaffold286_size23798//19800//21261//NITZ4_008455-RA/size23798-snap-gene-0.3-mRNA-1//1//CDS//3329545753//5116//frame0